MPARILDGTAIAQQIRGELRDRITQFTRRTGRPPGLGIVLVGEKPDSEIYVRNKLKTAGEAGFRADLERLPAGIAALRAKLTNGRLDALVNNAGISPKGPNGERLGALETDIATWLHVYSVNLFSIAMLGRGLFADLERAQGSIVNVTSIAGGRVHPFAGIAYSTSKAALAALTREMAHDFGQHGVRVNAIAPGEIDTAILSPGTNAIVEHQIPMRRLGRPEEVAATIYFLCTAPASYVNGAEIHINGGEHV